MTASKVAVVLSPQELKHIIGLDGVYGVCLVDGDIEQCFLFMSKEELQNALKGYASCPGGYTDTVGLLDLDVELTAIARIADFAASKASEIASSPTKNHVLDGHKDYGGRHYRGIKVRLTNFGLDIMVSDDLINVLGWREGDVLTLKVSPCSRLFSIGLAEMSEDTPILIRVMDEPENYVVDRVFTNIPIYVELNETDWISVPFHLHDNTILLPSEFASKKDSLHVDCSFSEVTSIPERPKNMTHISVWFFALLAISFIFASRIF